MDGARAHDALVYQGIVEPERLVFTSAAQTAVTWSMAGRNSFMSKAVGLVMNMDKMVGGQFERGLANLKSVTEMAARTS